MAFMAGSLVMAAGIRGFFGTPDVAMPIAGYVALGHLGAGFAATVDIVTHHAEVAPIVGKLSVGLSVALYMLGLWLVRDRYLAAGRNVLPVAAAAALVASFPPFAIEAIALVSIAAVIARERLTPTRS